MARPRRLPGQQARLGAHRRARTGRPVRTSAAWPRTTRSSRTTPLSRRSCTTRSAARRSSSRAPGRAPCPSDFRVRSLDGIADDWPIDYFELLPYFDRTDRAVRRVGACRATRPTRPTPRTRRCRRCPSGRPGSRSPAAHTKLGWHWWPEFNSINSVAYDGRRPCVQRSTCQSGCNEGAKASTDLTHWPKAIALGARLVTGARVRRIETNADGPGDRRDLDRTGWRRAFRAGAGRRPGGATRSARRGCCCSRRATAIRTGLANSSGLVGKRLMMHPFANVAGLFEEPLMSWQGQFGDLIESLEFYETDEKRGFVRGARWGLAPTGGPINTALPEPCRRTGLGPRAPHPRQDPPRPRRELGSLRRGPARRGEPHHALVDGHRLVRHPGPRDPLHDGRERPPHARLPHRAREGVDGRGRRVQDRGRPADALLGLAPARAPPGWATIRKTSVLDRWNRTHDVPNLYVVDGSCFVTSSGVNPTSTIVRDRPAGRGPHGRDPLRAAGAGVSRAEATTMPAGDPLASLDAAERAALGAVADTLIPAAHGMPSAAEILTDERLRFVLRARPDLVEPLRAALRPELGRRRPGSPGRPRPR